MTVRIERSGMLGSEKKSESLGDARAAAAPYCGSSLK